MIKKTKEERELSKLASRARYSESNKMFIKRKGKMMSDRKNIQAEMFEYIMSNGLIPDSLIDKHMKTGLNDIESLSERLSEVKAENKKYKQELSNLNKKYN